MDREKIEKIIKGLECCASMNGSACRECPYSSECNGVLYPTGTAHLAADALFLLKKQEAVEPVEEFIKDINRHDYHCKRCGNKVGTILDDKHPIFPGVKLSIKHFCDVCGQAVKWNE